jgi:hypothetical protein
MSVVEAQNIGPYLKHFTELVFHLNRAYSWFNTRVEAVQIHVEHAAMLVSSYMPENKSDFKSNSRAYKACRHEISLLLLKYVVDPEVKRIIKLENSSEIRQLSPKQKVYRKKFSDAVSEILRKLKKYVYEVESRGKKCTICRQVINLLILTCVGCRSSFHYRCLHNQDLKCTFCGTSLNETDQPTIALT